MCDGEFPPSSRRRPRKKWHAGKIEPIMIKPRFSIWKETIGMASATLALGQFGNPPLGRGILYPEASVRGAGSLPDRTLDADSSLVSRCLRGDDPAWEELVRVH